MALVDELHEQGDFWFRHRGKTMLLVLVLFVLALRESEWMETRFGDRVDDLYDWACIALSTAGLALRIAVAGRVPERTSGRNTAKGQVAGELNTTGAYSVVRHPLYLANFLIVLGICLTPGSLQFAVAASAVFWLVHERVMLAEEAFLRRKFGMEFEAWAARTPALVPALRRYRRAALPYSLRTAVKREYLTVQAAVLVFCAVDYVEDLFAGRFEWEPETTLPALGVVVLCGVLRYLRKHTRVLHVAGR